MAEVIDLTASISPMPIRFIQDSILEDIEVDEEVFALFGRLVEGEIRQLEIELLRLHVRVADIRKAVKAYVLDMPESPIQPAQEIMSTLDSTVSPSASPPPPSLSSATPIIIILTDGKGHRNFPNAPEVMTRRNIVSYIMAFSEVVFERYQAGIDKLRESQGIFRRAHEMFQVLRKDTESAERVTLEEALDYYKRADDMLTDINHWSTDIQEARREVVASTDMNRTVPRMQHRRLPASAPTSPKRPVEIPSPIEVEDINIDETVRFGQPDVTDPVNPSDESTEEDHPEARPYYPLDHAETCRREFVELHTSVLDHMTEFLSPGGILSPASVRGIFVNSEGIRMRKELYESSFREATRQVEKTCHKIRAAIVSIKGKVRGHTVFATTALCRIQRGMAKKIVEHRQRSSGLKKQKTSGSGSGRGRATSVK